MRIAHLFAVSLFVGSIFVACGDDGGEGMVDAPNVVVDAPMIDAPTPLTGIGQTCTQSTPCPTSAPICLVAGTSTTGMCSQECVASSTFMTDANMMPGAFNPSPSAQNATCAAAYTGTVGTSSCAFPYDLTPAHSPLMANTTYTIKFACSVNCGPGNTCPTGLTCNTQIMQCRVP